VPQQKDPQKSSFPGARSFFSNIIKSKFEFP